MKTKEMQENFRQQSEVKGDTPRSVYGNMSSGKDVGRGTVNKNVKEVRGK